MGGGVHFYPVRSLYFMTNSATQQLLLQVSAHVLVLSSWVTLTSHDVTREHNNVDALTEPLTSSMKWDHNSACFLGLSGEGVGTWLTGSETDALSTLVSSMAVMSQAFIYMPGWDELIQGYSSPLTHNGPAPYIPLTDEEAAGHMATWLE